jgi:formylglycine-generating enzyme required for sulfatase activity
MHHVATVAPYTDRETGEGFVYVPAETAILGGDGEAYDSLPCQEVSVPGFAIARFPVTFRDYAEFLNELERRSPAEARRRAVTRRIRSGIWNGDHKWARAASRSRMAAVQRGPGLGFRLAKDLPKRS